MTSFLLLLSVLLFLRLLSVLLRSKKFFTAVI